jgi:regulator of sirC expression with transglutaminase-like and TPR domain
LHSHQPPDPPADNEQVTAEKIARLIGQLDADSFVDRERASLELARIGYPALPALRAAQTHKSAEVRYRAKNIANSLTSGVRLREFSEFASQPDEQLDLEHGMWLIARILDPQVQKPALTRQLDQLADRVREKLGKGIEPASSEPRKVVDAVRQVLFTDERFTGNTEDYNNPDNSSLARVLETRKGLPILLSHVTAAVARRLRVPIIGVPAPGRYLAKYDGSRAPAGYSNADIVFNPFEGGKLLTDAERPQGVANDTNREALTRMLRNLTSALAARDDKADEQKQVGQLLDLLNAYSPMPDAAP